MGEGLPAVPPHVRRHGRGGTWGVDAAFVYTFARYDLPHRDDPHVDLDRASAGVVKVLDGESRARDPRGRRYPDMPWEPKAAFDALADCFGRWRDAGGVPTSR